MSCCRVSRSRHLASNISKLSIPACKGDSMTGSWMPFSLRRSRIFLGRPACLGAGGITSTASFFHGQPFEKNFV